MWGTDSPPGLADPYGNVSVFDQTKKGAQEEVDAERQNKQRSRVTLADLDPSYVPASTWDGLERVGGFGGWWKENWDPDHPFEGFLPRDEIKDTNTVTSALRRALIEVFALRQAGLPLSEIPRTISTWEPSRYIQILPTATGATLQFSQGASLDKVIQSLAPTIDETAVKENPSESEADVAADRSTVDPLHRDEPVDGDETAVKGNPSESEADVAADRSTVDPLHPGEPVGVDETATNGNPTESEADVAADRLTGYPNSSNKFVSQPEDLSWLEIPLEDPEVKFAVSNGGP